MMVSFLLSLSLSLRFPCFYNSLVMLLLLLLMMMIIIIIIIIRSLVVYFCQLNKKESKENV